MRINLACPYADKDQAKALGARWDAEGRVWYVIDPKDLSKFSKWLPTNPKDKKQRLSKSRARYKAKEIDRARPRFTVGNKYQPLCSCTIPPWEHCEHTEYQIPERGNDGRTT